MHFETRRAMYRACFRSVVCEVGFHKAAWPNNQSTIWDRTLSAHKKKKLTCKLHQKMTCSLLQQQRREHQALHRSSLFNNLQKQLRMDRQRTGQIWVVVDMAECIRLCLRIAQAMLTIVLILPQLEVRQDPETPKKKLCTYQVLFVFATMAVFPWIAVRTCIP